jgi:Flp pilus assembly protein TadD
MWKWLIGVGVVLGGLACVGGAVTGGAYWWAQRELALAEAAMVAAVAAEEAAAAEAVAAEAAARETARAAAAAAAASSDPERAVGGYTELLVQNPDDLEALLGRGRAYARLERFEAAEVDLRAVTTRAPERREAWETLAWVLVREGRDAEAVVAYDRLLALAGEVPTILRDRGNARFLSGDAVGAEADARRACLLGLDAGCALEARIRATRGR